MKTETENELSSDCSSHDLLKLNVHEIETAIAIFRRCHDLLYGKMGSALAKSMKDPLPDDGKETGKAWLDGYEQGREVGLNCFPGKIAEIPIGEIIAAIYAPNTAFSAPDKP